MSESCQNQLRTLIGLLAAVLGLPGRLLRLFWVPGASWGLPGRPSYDLPAAFLQPSYGLPGAFLGPLWDLPGPSWGSLSAPCRGGALWSALGGHLCALGCSLLVVAGRVVERIGWNAWAFQASARTSCARGARHSHLLELRRRGMQSKLTKSARNCPRH